MNAFKGLCFVAVMLLSAPPLAAEALMRPAPDVLAGEIGAAGSLMSRDALIAGRDAVMELDRRTLVFVRTQGLAPDFSDGWRGRVNDMTSALPAPTPDGERLLLYAIQLQIEMLDGVLARRSAPLREQMRSDRRVVRVASPERDRIFGDARDRYVAEMVRGLGSLAALQQALGAPVAAPVRLPVGMGDMREVEAYLLKQIREAAVRAAKVH